MSGLNIKKGDTVVVITGKDKGKKGKVLASLPKENRVVVDGVNIQKKSVKPRSTKEQGGIIKQEGTIDVSNVMVLCPKCGKGTRVGYQFDAKGKKIRVCKKCNEKIPDKSLVKKDKADSEAKKASKKPAKSTEKADKIEV